MKQFKMMIPLMALVLGLFGAFAFTPAPQSRNMTQAWFEIIDPNGSTSSQSNYRHLPGTPECNEEEVLCAVYAEVDASNPQQLKPNAQDIQNISDNLKRFQD